MADDNQEQYILHLAQLVPDEGTLCLLDAYKKFHQRREADSPGRPVPKLLLCHSSSPNDDDRAPVYASIITHIENTMPELAQSITIIQLRPPDQLWNVLISKAMAIVQLNDSEGIPEMLLGAAQKGKPVIVGEKCGYLSFLKEEVGAIVLDGDYTEGIAHHLLRLAADVSRGKSQPGAEGSTAFNARCTTVGNAVSWFYLASKLSKGEVVELGERDVYTLAEEERRDS